MTEFLVKHFVKDYENTGDAHVRTAYGVLSSAVGIACNLLLFIGKAFIGMILGSVAVTADAFNNLSDACSSIISFVGIRLADRPADREHPFGHGRYEYIAALIVAFLVIEVGISFVRSSAAKIMSPQELNFHLVSVIILCLSVLVKLWMFFFNRKLGRRIHSTVMAATSADALGDVLTTSATIFSLFVYQFLGWNLDGIVGLLVAVVVILAGVNIAKDTITPLIGERPDPELARNIENRVLSYDGVLGVHDLVIHTYGPTKGMATIHAEMSAMETLGEAHQLADHIEREVTARTGISLVIHMDPVHVEDPFENIWRERVFSMITELDPQVSAHDFQVVREEDQTTFFFDLIVPYTYHLSQTHQLIVDLEKSIQAEDPSVQCVIVIDHDLTHELSGAKEKDKR